MDWTRLSRVTSHALRHEPWLYELELDDGGWTPLADLIAALKIERPDWADLKPADFAAMITASDKTRYEISDERIRALYGHSTPEKLVKDPATPPAQLFHGTSSEAAPTILQIGLEPMGRQYVHLSADTFTALQVGRRKSASTVILTVDAAAASAEGVIFYRGNDKVWLADQVPARFLR